MFRGTSEHVIDDKGRISVPARFRQALRKSDRGRLVVTNFIVRNVRCLEVYPLSAWTELEQRLSRREDLDPDVLRFFHDYYFPGAQECELDGQGRLLVPPRLREYANLSKDVVLTGAVRKFRVFDRDAWLPVFMEGEQLAATNPRVYAELGV